MSETEAKEILKDFLKCRKSISRVWPDFPMKWPHTRQGIREMPGYEAFDKLRPETRYFLFMCAFGQNIRYGQINTSIENAVKEFLESTP